MPALRVGYIVASGPVLDLLRKRKQMTDLLGTSTLIQRALETYVTVGRYESYLNRAKRIYRERRDAMEAAIAKHMPEETTWMSPHGGLFIWLRLPEDVSADDLYPIGQRSRCLSLGRRLSGCWRDLRLPRSYLSGGVCALPGVFGLALGGGPRRRRLLHLWLLPSGDQRSSEREPAVRQEGHDHLPIGSAGQPIERSGRPGAGPGSGRVLAWGHV